MRAEIHTAYPEHGILNEEEGGNFARPLTWVIDPIDGTKSFITGMPLFGTLIALADHGRPILGMIDMPVLGERWHGYGGRAWYNGWPIRTSQRQLSNARLIATSPDMFKGTDAKRFATLSAKVGMRRFGGDCYAYGLLASGHCDLIVESGLQIYDVMALVPVIDGAGGFVTDWKGKDIGPGFDGRIMAAANARLHAQSLSYVS